MVKLGKAKNPKGVSADVKKTYDGVQLYPTKDIHDDGEQTISNIDVSTTIPIVDNITNLGMIPYYYKFYICFLVVWSTLLFVVFCFGPTYVLFAWILTLT
jgi:hypothetical protein